MADINSNEHGMLEWKFWQSQVVEIATRFGIDLSQDSRSKLVSKLFLHLSFADILLENNLRDNTGPVKSAFDIWIVLELRQ